MKKEKDKEVTSYGWVVKNLALAAAFVAAVLIFVTVALNLITHHNKVLTVPDLTNLTYEEARDVAHKAGVRVVVNDSIYIRRLRPGAIYMQTPKAGESVKKGRRIRVTTNTMVIKQVSMPSLVGFSMRQAKAELSRAGLVLGRLIYTRDIATDNVLGQQYRGRNIKPGTLIQSGSTIDLVVGLNSSDSKTYVPNLVGKQYLRAVDVIQENSLNVGKLTFDKNIKTYADSVSAVVYSQKPGYSSQALKKGAEVALYLTNDKEKIDGIK